MHILLASLLLTTVSPASAVSPLTQTYNDGVDDGYAYRIESGVDDFYPQYGRDHDATIRVAASTGFTIEEFEASSDDLLPGADDSTNTGSNKRPSNPALTFDLEKMGPCCPADSPPHSTWMPFASFCQHSYWRGDRNGNGKWDREEQFWEVHEKGHRDPKTGICKVGPALADGAQGRRPGRARSQPKSRDRARSKTKPPPSSDTSRAGPPGTTFDCDIGLQSMGVRVVKSRFAKIQHMKDGRGSFGCYYQISGVKSDTHISAGWVEAPYKRGRYTFGKTNCGQGLQSRKYGPPPAGMPAADFAYFSDVNGKAAYVSTSDYFSHKTKRRNVDIIGVNRFKAIAEKILAQIAPHAVDCPK